MASMEGDVAVLGQQNHVAVWNSKHLEERLFKKDPFTEDDAKQLAEFGI
jgi:DNA-binding transcriptional regulator/RsmH inhibitor MraZ